MKSIFRKSLFGLLVLPVFLLIPNAKPAEAAVVCSGMPVPIMSIVVNGTTYANNSLNRDASYSISVASGTTLPVSFSNSSTGATPYNISRSYPNGHTLSYTSNPGTLSYTTDPITSNTLFAIGVDRDCVEDPTVEGGGSVQVNVTVTAAYTLSASKAGAGTGTVTSSPSGVNCGADCSESYASGTSVTLTATPAGGSTFGGWSGACSGTGSCVVSMTQARSVTATFNTAYTLSVSKAGTGTGTVTSAPAGVNCGADCSEAYTSGTSVTLTATPTSGTFAGWSGACSGTGSCVVSMTQARSVTATFNASGSTPSCSPNSSSVQINTPTTITASGGSGGVSPFYTWSTDGGGSCSGTTCSVSYSTTGTKNITTTRNGVTSTVCTVNVQFTDNLPTAAFTGSTPAACTVTGWGDDIDTTVPRPIRIYSDGSLVSTVTAGATGCTGSACTFSANLTNLVSTGVAHNITGEVQNDTGAWRAFTNSQTSLSLTCPTVGVSCIGPVAGQTNTSYDFSASGGAAHTWGVSPTGSMTPSGATGSGSSVSKSFSQAGQKTITFTRTDTGATGQCMIDISTAPPALSFNLLINGSQGPLTVAYGTTPITLSWTSGGANTVQKQGSTPADPLWGTAESIPLAGSQDVSPATVRRTYDARAVKSSPLPVQTNTDSVILRVTPECLPAGQTVTVNQPATLTARGGNGTYAWTSTGGTPASGSGSSYNVTYAVAGTYSVGLTSDSLTATNCSVTVNPVAPPPTGTVVVVSNLPTTWSLTSTATSTRNETVQQTSKTYSNMPAGGYTLTNVPEIVLYDLDPISPSSSQTLAAGGTITFTINYQDEPAPPPGGEDVDLKINNSDNPTPVANGSTVALSWTSTSGIVEGSCVASEGIAPWSGSRDNSGSETSGVLSGATTFTITCDTEKDGPVDDSVTIVVTFPQCSDSIDNDGQGDIDFPIDPDCDDPEDNNEQGDDDDTGGDVTECSDGFDNDGDGGIDYVASGTGGDVNCSSLLDDDERGSPDIREI